MRTILASSGFTNEEIIRACEELVGKPRQKINFIILNEAIKAEKGDHRWFAESLAEITNNFGGTIELSDLQAHDLDYAKERIATCDVVFCFGGQTDYLKKVFEETGFAGYLPELLEEKVWVGSSAGSCVLCHKESKDPQSISSWKARKTVTTWNCCQSSSCRILAPTGFRNSRKKSPLKKAT